MLTRIIVRGVIKKNLGFPCRNEELDEKIEGPYYWRDIVKIERDKRLILRGKQKIPFLYLE